MKTETKVLSAAMYILARDIQSEDGVANCAIKEAASRLNEQAIELLYLRGALRECRTWIDETYKNRMITKGPPKLSIFEDDEKTKAKKKRKARA